MKVWEPIVFQKPGEQARAPKDFFNQSALAMQASIRINI